MYGQLSTTIAFHFSHTRRTLIEHTFFRIFHQLSLELKHLLSKINVVDRIPFQEVAIWNGCLKKFDTNLEKMLIEDLCAMDRATEDKIAGMLQKRLANGDSYTFAGDVLLAINANELPGDIPSSVWIGAFFLLLNTFAVSAIH